MRTPTYRLRRRGIATGVLPLTIMLALALPACGDDNEDVRREGLTGTGVPAVEATPSGGGSDDESGGALGGGAADGASGGASAGGHTATGDAASTRRDAARAKATLARMYAALRRSDVATVCGTMTRAAQHNVAIAVNRDKGATCERTLGRYYAFAEKDGSLKATLGARVVDATVTGNRAVVRVRFPTTDRLRRVRMVRVGDSWKLPVLP